MYKFLNNKNLINIVAISNSVKNLLLKSIKLLQIKLLFYQVHHQSKFPPRLNVNKRLKVGYFGSISPSKGINTLIKLLK